MKEENKIVEGVIWKQVLLFFIPIAIGSFFQHLYTIIDTIIVGKVLGTLSLSAVGGSASKVIVLLINFFIGVSCGITALSARYYGKKDKSMLYSIIYNGTILFTICGFVLSVLGIIYSTDILVLLKTPVETIEIANVYLRTYLFGLLSCILYNLFAGILRALGDSKRPLYILIFCSIVNIVLDLLFTYVFNMGVFGIALATVIAQTISFIILIFILKNQLKDFSIKGIKTSISVMKEICVIGIPAGIQSIMFSLSNMVVQSGVNTFGSISVASWSSYVKIDSIVDIFVSSLGGTVITFVGQNLGAKRIDRIKQSVNQIIMLSYCIVSVLVLLFILNRTFLISLFTEDKEVIALGSNLMCIILPMYLLTIPQQVYSQALRGLGKSFVPMILTLFGVIGVRILWVLVFLPKNPTISFLASCYPFSALLMSTIFAIYYRIEIKKLNCVLDSSNK